MTITEEVIHELKRLRIKANNDLQKAMVKFNPVATVKAIAFKNGLNMAIRVATQINNRRTRKK